MVLVTIQFLYQMNHKITFGQMSKRKKMMIDHRFQAYEKLKKNFNLF